jgi:four helix bundle protein
MSDIKSFRDLEVWQRGMALAEVVYAVTRLLPREEFDLRRQMRRASVSIPSNVAEGWRRRSRRAYQNHVSIALGSQAELDTELELAVRTKLLPSESIENANALVIRVGQMLTRLHQQLSPPQDL